MGCIYFETACNLTKPCLYSVNDRSCKATRAFIWYSQAYIQYVMSMSKKIDIFTNLVTKTNW